jgi:hypothetical protein
VRRSKTLYERSSDRNRNIGIHEAVAAAMQGNFINANGIDNTVNRAQVCACLKHVSREAVPQSAR